MKSKTGLLVSIPALILGAGLVLGLTSGVGLYGFGGDDPTADIKLYDIYKKDNCNLWLSFQNTGTTAINATLRVKVLVQNVMIENVLEEFSLAPQAFFNREVGANPSYKISGINKSVTAIVDADNMLAESDETNNSLTKTLSCGTIQAQAMKAKSLVPRPDLSIPSIKFQVVQEGDNSLGHYVVFNALVYVKNDGTANAGPFDVLLQHQINGTGPYLTCGTCKIHVAGLDAGQGLQLPARQFSKHGTPTSGELLVFTATADCDHVITESNENNNGDRESYPRPPTHK